METLENLNTVETQVTNYLQDVHKDWTLEKCRKVALERIEADGGIMFYVSLLGTPIIKDISINARVKSPAKYFKVYEAAKIFQLRTILETKDESIMKDLINHVLLHKLTMADFYDMQNQLNKMVEEFPEYAI